MPTNDNSDMQRMQQDAIRRVQEMHSRAQQSLNTLNRPQEPPRPQEPSHGPAQGNAPRPAPPRPSPTPAPPHFAAPRPPAHPPAQEHRPPPEPERPPAREPDDKPPENSLTDLFGGLLKDSERTLILVLILLLISEKADTGLVFALMYLII